MMLAVAALLAAAPPAPPAPPPPIEQVARGEAGLSPAGTAIVTAWVRESRLAERRRARELDAVGKAIHHLAIGQELDVMRFRQLVGRQDRLKAEQSASQAQAYLSLLARLTPADRAQLLKNVGPVAGSDPAGAPRGR